MKPEIDLELHGEGGAGGLGRDQPGNSESSWWLPIPCFIPDAVAQQVWCSEWHLAPGGAVSPAGQEQVWQRLTGRVWPAQ